MIESLSLVFFNPLFIVGYFFAFTIPLFFRKISYYYRVLFLSQSFLSFYNLFIYGFDYYANKVQHAEYYTVVISTYICVMLTTKDVGISRFCFFISIMYIPFAFIKGSISIDSYNELAIAIFNYSKINIDLIFNSIVTFLDLAILIKGVRLGRSIRASRPDF